MASKDNAPQRFLARVCHFRPLAGSIFICCFLPLAALPFLATAGTLQPRPIRELNPRVASDGEPVLAAPPLFSALPAVGQHAAYGYSVSSAAGVQNAAALAVGVTDPIPDFGSPEVGEIDLSWADNDTPESEFELNVGGLFHYNDVLQLPSVGRIVPPAISVSYSHETPNTYLGAGFRLNGISKIWRCSKNIPDNRTLAIKFDVNDAFCLDQQKLVLVSANVAAKTAEFQIQSNPNVDLHAEVGASGDVDSFALSAEDGTVEIYGADAQSRNTSTGGTLDWFKSTSTKQNGDAVSWVYVKSNAGAFPSDIFWGPVTNPKFFNLHFATSSRSDYRLYYQHGMLQRYDFRLDRATYSENKKDVTHFDFHYAPPASSTDLLLQSVQQCDFSGTCLPATTFSWTAPPGLPVSFSNRTSINGIASLGVERWLRDINGDGLPDFVSFNGATISWNINKGNGSFGPTQSQSLQMPAGSVRWLEDVNGDGYPDLVVKTADAQIYWVLNRGTDFDASRSWATVQVSNNVHGLGTLQWLQDINGDGLPDYVVKTADGNIHWDMNTGNGWGPRQTQAGMHGIGVEAWLIDINGDGLPDYVTKTDDGNIHWDLNTGAGYDTASAFGARQTQGEMHGIGAVRWLIDINGDGLPDYVVKTENGYIHWNLNTGTGWGPRQSQGGLHGLGAVQWLIDVDGDGLPDYVAKEEDGNFYWDRNRGTGFDVSAAFGPPQTVTGPMHGLGSARWMEDITGDGMIDYVAKTDNDFLHFNVLTSPPIELLSNVNSLGRPQIALEYFSRGLSGSYTPPSIGNGSAASSLPRFLLSKLTKQYGAGRTETLSYSYGGARVDVARHRWLGFQSVFMTDSARGRTTAEEYAQDLPVSGLLRHSSWTDDAGHLLRDATYDWNATPVGPATLVRELHRKVSRWNSNATSLSSVERFADYNGRGYPTRYSAQREDSRKRDQTLTYSDITARHIFGLVTSKVTTSSGLHGPPYVTKALTSYDGYGYPSGSSDELQGVLGEHGFRFIRDSKGQVASSTEWASGEADRVSTFSYDDLGNPKLVLDPMGHSWKSEYDLAVGKQLSLTDPNNIVVWHDTFDAFGRVTSHSAADGSSSSWQYKYTGTEPEPIVIERARNSGALTRLVLDASGRPRAVEQPSGTGGIVTKNFLYDAAGRMVVYQPSHFLGEPPRQTEIQYDPLDRISLIRNSDGTSSAVTYDGGTVRRVDERGRQWQKRRIFADDILEYIDPLGRTRRFGYDAQGNVVSAWREQNILSEIYYDSAGRITSSWDRNGCPTGTMRNPFGEIRATNSCGRETNYYYDRLGRLVKKVAGGSTISWNFDTGSDGIGRTSGIHFDDGTQKIFLYNSNGTLSAERVKMSGFPDYESQYDYDSTGRVSALTYPAGLGKVVYEYNAFGSIQNVRWNGQLVYQLVKEFYDGQPSESLEAGVRRNESRDATTDRTSAIEYTASSGILWGQDYAYTVDGRLTLMVEKPAEISHGFTFDLLDRLASESTNQAGSSAIAAWNFDNEGNKFPIARGEEWQFGTESAPPEALSAIVGNGNKQRFIYDSSGRTTSFRGDLFRYNSLGDLDLAQIRRGTCGYQIQFQHDEERRIRSQSQLALPGSSKKCTGGSRSLLFDNLFKAHFESGAWSGLGIIYVGKRPVAAIVKRNSEMRPFVIATDRQGSWAAVIDPSGKVAAHFRYGGWGEILDESAIPFLAGALGPMGGVRPGYLGARYDPLLQMSSLGARLYSARLGRFLSVEPNLAAFGFAESMNRYAYGENNPIRNMDKRGLFKNFDDPDDPDEPDVGVDDPAGSDNADPEPPPPVNGSAFEDKETELYYTDTGYLHMNFDWGVFTLEGIAAEFEGFAFSTGTIESNGKKENFMSLDADAEDFSVSGFKVGKDQYGIGLGTGGDFGWGSYGIGAHGEVFGMAGDDGKYEVGFMSTGAISSAVGPDINQGGAEGVMKGAGLYVSAQPEWGGAVIRAYADLVREIKSMTGYYTMCPTCR